MLLYQSTSNPWDTTFCNAEGQIIYKTENPIYPHSRTANQIAIKRILPSNSNDLATASEDALRDSFSDLAELHFGLLSAARIRYNGIEKNTSQFFRKANILSSGRIFTGPDGKEYEWKLRLVDCKLYLKDTKTLVARYHPRNLGEHLGPGRAEASLEIFPEGQHMVDLIFVTFIYFFVEKYQSGDILA